jgi:hypothetical protein
LGKPSPTGLQSSPTARTRFLLCVLENKDEYKSHNFLGTKQNHWRTKCCMQ